MKSTYYHKVVASRRLTFIQPRDDDGTDWTVPMAGGKCPMCAVSGDKCPEHVLCFLQGETYDAIITQKLVPPDWPFVKRIHRWIPILCC